MQKTGVFVLALLSAFASVPVLGQTPSSLPIRATDTSPFCEVRAWVRGPLASTDPAYIVALHSDIPGTMSTHITLIADSGAYDALLPDTALVAAPYGGFTTARRMLVMLPPGTAGKYAFVDSYTIVGKEKVTCPTEPSEIDATVPASAATSDTHSVTKGTVPEATGDATHIVAVAPVPGATAAATNVAATLLQALPQMPCGKMFTNARVNGYSPLVGFYGNRELNADVHIYIDSGGNLVKASIWKSSGVAGVDEAALSSAQHSTYTAAKLLCTPVVGSFLFTFTYKP